MIHCNIVLGEDRRPADTFHESTTRIVCVPSVDLAFLDCWVDREADIQVVVDDEPVHEETLRAGRTVKSITDLLTAEDPDDGPFARLRRREPQPIPRRFKVIFTHVNSERVIATFQFQMEDCTAYQRRQTSVTRMHQFAMPEINLTHRKGRNR